jgi:hypothetical protein
VRRRITYGRGTSQARAEWGLRASAASCPRSMEQAALARPSHQACRSAGNPSQGRLSRRVVCRLCGQPAVCNHCIVRGFVAFTVAALVSVAGRTPFEKVICVAGRSKPAVHNTVMQDLQSLWLPPLWCAARFRARRRAALLAKWDLVEPKRLQGRCRPQARGAPPDILQATPRAL